MITTAEIHYKHDEIELAELGKAISHPARVAILKELASVKHKTCGDLVKVIGLSQPTVSQHLKALVEVGFICQKIEGTRSYYCMEWNKLERFFMIVDKLSDRMLPNRPKRNCC